MYLCAMLPVTLKRTLSKIKSSDCGLTVLCTSMNSHWNCTTNRSVWKACSAPYRPHALCDGAAEYNMDNVNPGEVIGRNNDIYRSQKTVRTTLLGRNNSYLCQRIRKFKATGY